MSIRKKKPGTLDPVVEVIIIFNDTGFGIKSKGDVNVGRIDLWGDPKKDVLYSTINQLADVCKKTFFSVGFGLSGKAEDHYDGVPLDVILSTLDHPMRSHCEGLFNTWKSVHPLLFAIDSWDTLEAEFSMVGNGGTFSVVIQRLGDLVTLGKGPSKTYGAISIAHDAMVMFDQYLKRNGVKHSPVRDASKYSIKFDNVKDGYALTLIYGSITIVKKCTLKTLWYSLHSAMKELDESS